MRKLICTTCGCGWRVVELVDREQVGNGLNTKDAGAKAQAFTILSAKYTFFPQKLIVYRRFLIKSGIFTMCGKKRGIKK